MYIIMHLIVKLYWWPLALKSLRKIFNPLKALKFLNLFAFLLCTKIQPVENSHSSCQRQRSQQSSTCSFFRDLIDISPISHLIVQFHNIHNFNSILFIICTCVTTLHLCCMKMHLFSANKKCIIFSCILSWI